MITDPTVPDAHQPWCEDRTRPISQGHLGDRSARCESRPIKIGSLWVYLVEGDTGVNVHIDEREYTIPQAVQIAAAVHTAINTLGGAE